MWDKGNYQAKHFQQSPTSYTAPDLTEPPPAFDAAEMRALLDSHHIADRDRLFNLIIKNSNNLFNAAARGGRVFVSPDYNHSMEQHREITMKRIEYLLHCGVFNRCLTGDTEEDELRKMALNEVVAVYDHSLAINVYRNSLE